MLRSLPPPTAAAAAGCRPARQAPSSRIPAAARRHLVVVAAKKGGGGKKGGGQKKGPGSLMNPPKPTEPWLQVLVLSAEPVCAGGVCYGVVDYGNKQRSCGSSPTLASCLRGCMLLSASAAAVTTAAPAVAPVHCGGSRLRPAAACWPTPTGPNHLMRPLSAFTRLDLLASLLSTRGAPS